MAKVLVVWELGGNFGHVASLAPILDELKRRGHELMAAFCRLGDVPHFIDRDVQLFQAPQATPPAPGVRPPPQLSYADLIAFAGYRSPGELSILLRAWSSLYELAKPDLVVFESAPTALLAARPFKFIKAIFGSGFSLPPRRVPLPPLLPDRNPPLQDIVRNENAIVSVINQALTLIEREPIAALKDLFQSDLDLLKTVPELDQYTGREDGEYVGPFYSVDAGRELAFPKVPGKKVFVYVRAPWRFDLLLARLARQPLSVLAVIPQISAEFSAKLSAPNVTISAEPAKLRALIKEADVAICHSAVGTGAAFLFGGVPLLLSPVNLEQLMSAQRVAQYGAGFVARTDQPNPPYEEMVRALCEKPEYRARARALAQKYGGEEGDRVTLVCERLESELKKRA